MSRSRPRRARVGAGHVRRRRRRRSPWNDELLARWFTRWAHRATVEHTMTALIPVVGAGCRNSLPTAISQRSASALAHDVACSRSARSVTEQNANGAAKRCSFSSFLFLYLFTVITRSETDDPPVVHASRCVVPAFSAGTFPTCTAVTTHSRTTNAAWFWPVLHRSSHMQLSLVIETC